MDVSQQGSLLGVTSTIMAGCAQDLEAQGDRPGVVKPLIVLSDYHESYGPGEAWEAKNALLWCQISNLHPILIAFGDPDLFEEVKQIKTREVFVESTSDEDLHKAFQVAGELVQVRLSRVLLDCDFLRSACALCPGFDYPDPLCRPR